MNDAQAVSAFLDELQAMIDKFKAAA